MAADLGSRHAEAAARAILSGFGISRLAQLDLRDLAYARGLLVQERPIDGAEGRMIRGRRHGLAVVDARIQQVGKKRFVIAHELGHFELHHDEPVFVCDSAAFFDWHRGRPAETEANRFAAELLMPRVAFQDDTRSTRPSMDIIDELARAYGVTPTAAAFRFVELDVAPSALVFCQHGQIVWTLLSQDFPFRYIRRNQEAHAHSGAGEYFALGKTSHDPVPTPLYAWFVDDDLPRNDRCYEQCRVMPALDATLSLLWMD